MTTDPVPALFGCEDIHIRLGGRPILEGVTVGIRPGEVLGVVGPNGAGKTTLFEVLSGRYAPDRGAEHLSHGKRVGHHWRLIGAAEAEAGAGE